MRIIKQYTAQRKILSVAILLAIFMAVFGAGNLPLAHAQMSGSYDLSPKMPKLISSALMGGYVVSDGQFVYGPNIGDFNLKNYLEVYAPHLSKYADDLYGRSEYFSINPKIYLTLLEIHSHLISVPEPALMEDSFGLKNGDFISQIDYLSNKMAEAYYLHLYSYSPLSVSQRDLEPFVTPGGVKINVAPDTNAGTYAIIAGLAAMDQQDIALILDNSQANGFYQTYMELFGNDDPLDAKNHIVIPAKKGVSAIPGNLLQRPGEVAGALAAPDNLLQLPFLRGLSWRFGGVHDTGGCSGIGASGCDFTDASSLDFYPSGSSWGMNTSNMWVVASASGIPTRISDCYFKILHNAGWETIYYHLENAPYISGSINQNDKIGVIANTLAEATCNGGASTGPHVHFSLRHNGAYVAINGTPLSGWYVHSGRYSYDVDHNYMWLERAGIKKYAYGDLVLSEGPPTPPIVVSSVRDMTSPNLLDVKFIVTFSDFVTGVDASDFSLMTTGVSGAAVSGVSGSGSVYTVTVNTGNGSGTIRLDVVDDDSIAGITHFPLAGAGVGNGNFSSGETYTINKNIEINVGSTITGAYSLDSSQSIRQRYPGLDNGPVNVESQNGLPIIASERIAYSPNGSTTQTDYSEIMGIPLDQLETSYWFPVYDNVSRNTALSFGNVGSAGTTVIVTIGGLERARYDLAPSQSIRPRLDGVNAGPVKVESTNSSVPIIASERFAYTPNNGATWNGFSETNGLPASQLTTSYMFSWYNNVKLNTQLRFANAGSSPTTVTVTIGGVVKGLYLIQPNTDKRVSYAGLDSGPVKVEGSDPTVPIIASERIAYISGGVQTSYSEIMGIPPDQLSDTYWFPIYDNVSRNTALSFGNVGSTGTTITITVAGVVRGTFDLAPNQSIRPRLAGINDGPVLVQSSGNVPIIASERFAYTPNNGVTWPGFSEMNGLPESQLRTSYLFSWYNNVKLNTQLRFGVP